MNMFAWVFSPIDMTKSLKVSYTDFTSALLLFELDIMQI